MSPSTATAEVSEPMASNPCSDGSREFGTDRSVRAAAARTSATGRTKSHRQFARSTRRADRYMPRMPPPPATPVQTPIALERSSSGKVEVMTARVTGMIIAAPAPARRRAASMTSVDGARPAAARHPEHREAGEEHRLAAPPVADRAEREQQRGEAERVDVDHP